MERYKKQRREGGWRERLGEKTKKGGKKKINTKNAVALRLARMV